MSRKAHHFRTPDPHYLTALATSVQSNLITQEESNFIEIFISEVHALSQISASRKYRIVHALTSFRKYCPPYLTCSTPEIFVAIERYRTGSNHAASTQQLFLLILKRFLLWLCESDYTPTLNAKKIKKITIKSAGITKTADDILTNDEIQAIIKNTKNIRDRALLELLYDSMGRVNEVATLRWGDIIFHDNYATVTLQSKTDYPRKVPIYTAHVALRQLKNYTPHTEPTDYIFASRGTEGKCPIGYQGVRTLLKRAAEKAGITKTVSPHLFRHTRITDLMRMKVSEQSIKMMAWGSISTNMLKIYAHLTVSDVENEMNQLYGVNLESRVTALPDIATPVQCKRCGLINPKLHEFCGGCAAPLSGDVQTKNEELLTMLEHNDMYDEFKEFLRSKIEA